MIKFAPLARRFGLLGPILTAAGLKSYLILTSVVPFNADEAIVALMAKHIMMGERPIFFYGQAYMGSLDAWLVAAGYLIFGEHVWVVRLIQALLYLGVIVTTYFLGNTIFGNHKAGLVAALLLAIPTVNVSLYTTASLGGYGEGLLMGNIILLTGLKILNDISQKGIILHSKMLVLGILSGLGLWAFGITLVYTIPLCLLLGWKILRTRKIKNLASGSFFVVLGGLIGSLPWWLFAWQHGIGGLIRELFGGAIAGVEGIPGVNQIAQHLTNLILLGSTVIFGFRPPWSADWLALPLLPFVLMFWVIVFWYSYMLIRREGKLQPGILLLHGIVWTLLFFFIVTPYGADPSGRYFLPLAIPLSLFGAVLILRVWKRSVWLGTGLFLLVISYNLWGTIQCALKYPPGLTTQFNSITQIDHRAMGELIDFLKGNNQKVGYTNYWVSYPLAFLSDEELIFIPRLPYHLDFRYTPRDDRYLPYRKRVSNAARVAYITTVHPMLDDYLRGKFEGLNLNWKEHQIGDYQIFYNISKPVHPEEIGLDDLGNLTNP